MKSILKMKKQPRWLLEIAGAIAIVLAYGAFSLAIDSGSWWHYLAGFIVLALGLKWLYLVINYHGGEDKTNKS